MAIYKEISAQDIKTSSDSFEQSINIIQSYVSASSTRRKYQNYVTGGIGPGVTSSLFQTVYDKDFSLQTANPIFDVTFGLYQSSSTVTYSKTGTDSAGKMLFPSTSLMMREKVNIYKQFSSLLLGDPDGYFVAPFDSTTTTDRIDEAFFICFKRLFHRDRIKRETFALRWYTTGSSNSTVGLHLTSYSGSATYTDVGSSTNKLVSYGGNVGNIINSANTAETVGLMFYDKGIAVLDLKKIISTSEEVNGVISAVNNTAGSSPTWAAGQTPIGITGKSENPNAKYIPDFVVSGSIDNILDHLCGCRMQSGSFTAMTFRNITNIHSTYIYCRINPDDFNYSSNPTFTDSENRIVVIDPGQEDVQQTFSFFTTVGLYDANNNLVAVGKTSRPIEKNPEKDLTVTLKLDF